jgi:hypothetical protein
MLAIRVALFAALLNLPQILTGQHQALHWYAFQSLLPLNAEEGKEALTVIREFTTDSISSFADKNDYFSFATKEEEDLDALADQLNESGFYLVDVTNPRLENQYHVRATKGYQYALLFCAEPNRFTQLTIGTIAVSQQVLSLLNPDFQDMILNSDKFILKEN